MEFREKLSLLHDHHETFTLHTKALIQIVFTKSILEIHKQVKDSSRNAKEPFSSGYDFETRIKVLVFRPANLTVVLVGPALFSYKINKLYILYFLLYSHSHLLAFLAYSGFRMVGCRKRSRIFGLIVFLMVIPSDRKPNTHANIIASKIDQSETHKLKI